jgi:hypothetical protein
MEGNEAVKALGIFNSGLLGGFELAGRLTKPTMYALGGPDDIAYGNVSFSWWMRERGEIAGHDELTFLSF